MNQSYKQKIEQLLPQIYLLKAAEQSVLLKRIQTIPEKGLVQIYSILLDAYKKQEEYVHAQITRDPQFIDDLNHSLQQSYKKATNAITEKEHEGAEHILDNLDDLLT